MDGIDLRESVPDKPLVVGTGDAIPKYVGVVVGQDESAQYEKERHADVARIEQQPAAAQCRHPRDQHDVMQIDEECRVKADPGQA